MSKMEGNLTGLIWGKYNGKGGLMQVTNSAGLSLRVFSEILGKLASSDACLKNYSFDPLRTWRAYCRSQSK